MNSKTKYPISDAEIQEVFTNANLGVVEQIEPLSDGWYNNVLAVTANGRDYVLKVAPETGVAVLTHERELLQQELRFITLLEERTDVRVPKVFASDLSKTILPCDYFIMEKLDGKRLDKVKFEGNGRTLVNKQINDILGMFHSISGEGFGYEQMELERNWYQALRRMTQVLVDDCRRFQQPCRIGTKLLHYIDLNQGILEPVPSVLVNFDLHDMNLFYEDGKLTVIDLERCFWGDWIGDCVMRGYQPPEEFSREEQIRFYLLMGYLGVVMYTEKYSRYRPWNKTWWFDVAGSRFFGLKSFAALKRLCQ